MSMLDELSKLYTETVHVTAAKLPKNWKTFWIRGEFKSSTYYYVAYYEISNGELVGFSLPDEGGTLIREAWKVSQSFNDRWTTLEITVRAPGELSVKFGHEDLDDESIDAHDRTLLFEAKTFGERKITSEPWTGGFSLTPDMLKSGLFQPNQ